MSWYTTIYPEGEFEETDNSVVQDAIDKSEALLEDCWLDIVASCAASPTDPKEAVRQFKSDLTKYIEFYKVYCRECFNSQYINSKENLTDENAKPSLDWNHFEHSSDPEDGIKDEQKSINYVKEKLIMLCAASPEKIYGNKDAEGNFVNPLDWMSEELRNLKEYLDESIYCKMFCELCVKYWDTHEIG